MTQADEPERTKPETTDTERAREAAKRRAADPPTDGGKADEGIRPDRLTTENDGGSQG